MTDYILLGFYKDGYNERTGEDSILIDQESWQISYEKEEKYYLCKQLYSGSVMKMKKTKSIESFIAIWIHDIELKETAYNTIKINLCIKDKYYSECKNRHVRTSKAMDIIAMRYANILKQIE